MRIRANSVADIAAIKQLVSLPVIGIIKRDYPDSEVFITATMKEVDELMSVGPELIALDAVIARGPVGSGWMRWSRKFVRSTRRCC